MDYVGLNGSEEPRRGRPGMMQKIRTILLRDAAHQVTSPRCIGGQDEAYDTPRIFSGPDSLACFLSPFANLGIAQADSGHITVVYLSR